MARPQKSLNLKNGVAGLGNLYDGYMAGNFPTAIDEDSIWYVDSNTSATAQDGKSWDTAFDTVQEAITAHNALIDWSATPMRYGVIYVAPGVYAENLTPAYYCYIIGGGVRGTDTSAEIHPATGSCLTGTLLGTVLINLRFETNEAVDCLNIGICNNSEIAYCVFTNGAAVAATALSTDNCTHLHFHHNWVESGQTTGMNYGLYFQGGSNKYAHNIHVHDNSMICTTSGVWIQNTCTASQARIGPHNMIWCSGGSGKGVDDNNGTSVVYGNWIRAVDAIEHAGGAAYTIGNSVVNTATGAKEASGS
jgi:hypothetical protein